LSPGWSGERSAAGRASAGTTGADPDQGRRRSLKSWDRGFATMLLGLIAGFVAAKIVNKQSAGFFLDIVRESEDFSRLPLGPTFAGGDDAVGATPIEI
jgi:hypothetical protein